MLYYRTIYYLYYILVRIYNDTLCGLHIVRKRAQDRIGPTDYLLGPWPQPYGLFLISRQIDPYKSLAPRPGAMSTNRL